MPHQNCPTQAYKRLPPETIDAPEHRALARWAASRVVVLLKNANRPGKSEGTHGDQEGDQENTKQSEESDQRKGSTGSKTGAGSETSSGSITARQASSIGDRSKDGQSTRTLPFDFEALGASESIALVGPNARNIQALWGDYAGPSAAANVTAYDAAIEELGAGRVRFAPGCADAQCTDDNGKPTPCAASYF